MRTVVVALTALGLLTSCSRALGESHAATSTDKPSKRADAASISNAASLPNNLWQLERETEKSGTLEEIRALLARVDEEAKKPEYEKWRFVVDREHLLEALLDRGGPQEFEDVLSTFDGMSSDDSMRSGYMRVLLRAKLRTVVQHAVQARPPQFALDRDSPLPDYLKGAPDRLVTAWRYYRGLEGSAVEPPTTRVAIQQNWPSFYKRVSDLLHSKSGDHYAAFAPFIWGGDCGTGFESLQEPKSTAQFIALVERGDFARAALLPVTQLFGRLGRPDWHDKFVEWTGIQLTRAQVGETLDRHAFSWPDPILKDSEVDEYALDLAAMDGLFTTAPDRSSLLWRIEKLLTPKGKKPTVVSSAIEEKLIDLLVHEASSEPPLPARGAALSALARLRRPETADTLRLGLTSTEYGVAEAVSTALESMPGGVAPATGRIEGEVAVHLNAGRLSLAGMTVKYRFRATPSSSSKEGSCVVAAGNICRIPRKAFATSARPITHLEIDSPAPTQITDPWFSTVVPFDPNVGDALELPVPVAALRIELTGLPKDRIGQELKLRLYYGEPYDLKRENTQLKPVGHDQLHQQLTVPAAPVIVLPSLKPGNYFGTFEMPGMVPFDLASKPIAHLQSGTTYKLPFRRGVELHFTPLGPGGDLREREPACTLVEVATAQERPCYAYPAVRGLAEGTWRLKFFSSEEARKRPPADPWRRGSGEPSDPPPPHEGYETTFLVNAKTPDVLDLGTLTLKEVR